MYFSGKIPRNFEPLIRIRTRHEAQGRHDTEAYGIHAAGTSRMQLLRHAWQHDLRKVTLQMLLLSVIMQSIHNAILRTRFSYFFPYKCCVVMAPLFGNVMVYVQYGLCKPLFHRGIPYSWLLFVVSFSGATISARAQFAQSGKSDGCS